MEETVDKIEEFKKLSRGEQMLVINKLVTNNCLKNIPELIVQSVCNHKWVEHGFGFKCMICNYYTGLYKELNDFIKST